MDTSVLLFTLIVALTTSLLFGLAPATQTTNPNLVSALKGRGHGTTTSSRAGRQMRGVLIIAEVTLAFVLLLRVKTPDAQLRQAFSKSIRDSTRRMS